MNWQVDVSLSPRKKSLSLVSNIVYNQIYYFKYY